MAGLMLLILDRLALWLLRRLAELVTPGPGGANDICCGTGLNLCPGNPVPGWLEDKSKGE
jgi:hypothetical protein